MATAILSSDGKITLPKSVQDALGVTDGDRLEFVRQADGRFVIVAASAPLMRLKGLLAHDGPPVSIEEMNAAIARGAAGE